MVVLTAGIFGVLTKRSLRQTVEAVVRDEIESVGDKASLEAQQPLSRWDAKALNSVTARALEHRLVASAMITDDHGETIALSVRGDPGVGDEAHTLALSATRGPLRTAIPVTVGGKRLGWSCRTPVWSGGSPSRLLGYVTVTGTDNEVGLITDAIPRAALLAGSAAVLVAGPLAVWAAAGLMRPVRRVAEAVKTLEQGQTPDPIAARGPREIRGLAGAFNAMAGSLTEAREYLEHSKAELEIAVQERTSQLVTINSVLEKQARAKNEFLRSVSHDLGAPLRNIAGMASLVLDEHADRLPPEAVQRLERITANVEIESTMLTELLELSRAAERTEHPSEICTATVADELARSLEHDLTARAIALTVLPGLPVLRVDRTDLWMLLQNLVDNAIKYMGDAPEKQITIAPWEDHGLSVRDTGPGIPEEDRPRVFRAFQRAAGCDSAPGRGVGLAVVRSITERWGATIELICPPGGGTRFEIRLPEHRVVRSQPEQAGQPSQPA